MSSDRVYGYTTGYITWGEKHKRLRNRPNGGETCLTCSPLRFLKSFSLISVILLFCRSSSVASSGMFSGMVLRPNGKMKVNRVLQGEFKEQEQILLLFFKQLYVNIMLMLPMNPHLLLLLCLIKKTKQNRRSTVNDIELTPLPGWRWHFQTGVGCAFQGHIFVYCEHVEVLARSSFISL